MFFNLLGGGILYPGEDLAKFGNMVVVTINYRLGPFGFFSSSGNEDFVKELTLCSL